MVIHLMSVGAFAVYLEPWHADVFEFLDLRKNHGKVAIECLALLKIFPFIKLKTYAVVS